MELKTKIEHKKTMEERGYHKTGFGWSKKTRYATINIYD